MENRENGTKVVEMRRATVEEVLKGIKEVREEVKEVRETQAEMCLAVSGLLCYTASSINGGFEKMSAKERAMILEALTGMSEVMIEQHAKLHGIEIPNMSDMHMKEIRSVDDLPEDMPEEIKEVIASIFKR